MCIYRVLEVFVYTYSTCEIINNPGMNTHEVQVHKDSMS